ncbi:MAG TPA: ABC transporter substrate-binding protein [Pseudonocardiaceae bacterium]|jgi:multiple sugar transport system substrate-binding protein|nr:ABC transporter substrate-binding protein [Pseudonocardiaceae bacterium]
MRPRVVRERRAAPTRVAVLLGAALLAAGLSAGCGSDDEGVVLRFYTPADGAAQYGEAAVRCTEAAGGRYRIEQQTLPRQADDQRLQLARRIVGGDETLDIMLLDVTWTAEFAEAEWILPFPPDVAARAQEGTLEAAYETGTWSGELFAAPLNTNTQLLWYREDLMPPSGPPGTWDEVITIAEDLAAQDRPSWIEVQAAQYEGITVWFNTLLTSAGGQIVADDGTTVTLAEGDAANRALEIMSHVAAARGADPSLSQRDEGAGRLAFESGAAAFQVNYPFVLPGIEENNGGSLIDERGNPTDQDTGRRVADVFAWAPYPSVVAGEPASVTIGGLNLAVSSTSRYPDQAFEAVQCLRNQENQLRNALDAGVPPTLEALYTDPAFRAEYPAWEAIKTSLDNASVRPESPAYQSISIVLSEALNPPREINPDTMVEDLARRVEDAVNSRGLVP